MYRPLTFEKLVDISVADELRGNELRAALIEILNGIEDDRDRSVLVAHFGLDRNQGRTWQEVSTELDGLSKITLNRIEQVILAKLRSDPSVRAKLEAYLVS